jgi:hypothetical protein
MSISDEVAKRAELIRQSRRSGLPEWQLEMSQAVGTQAIRGIVKDLYRGPAQRSSPIPEDRTEREAPPKGDGWVEAKALAPPPGIALIDRIVDAQDRLDRAELERRLGHADRKDR